MKTFISDIIPKLHKFSQKLDNLTLLTNQHWVAIDDIDNLKTLYIFRDNKELLISQNGKVEKAKWEYLGNNSLLIDRKNESYLFKQGFFDQNILALKIDSKDEYAFLINENKYDEEINSIEKVDDFLKENYINPKIAQKIRGVLGINESPVSQLVKHEITVLVYNTEKGKLEIEDTSNTNEDFYKGRKVFLNGIIAPTGKYKIGYMWFIHVKDGYSTESSIF